MVPDRLLSKVDRSGECWVWTGAQTGNGYGQAWDGTRKVRAHRLFYAAWIGKDIDDLEMVLHSCHNRLCVNPEHLREGDKPENTHDAYESGGMVPRRGALNGRCKLTEDDVHKIRADGRSSYEIAPEYGVTAKTIQQVKARESWAWLDDDEGQ